MHETGELVRQYRVVRRIGRGGMGEVYEAEDETLRRRVALKTIRAEERPSAREKSRFLREARILSRLDHPGICRIHDYIEGEDRDHLVLEFIRGRTLSDLEFPVRGRLGLVEQLLRVLAVAHENDIVHRDLKPDNVMVTDTGVLKVLDFGLARPGARLRGDADTVSAGGGPIVPADGVGDTFTIEAGILGTPAYMSPEQARGEPATSASDMYSCGLIIHFLLTGTGAYGEPGNVVRLLDRVRDADVLPLPGVDPDLADLVARLTHRSPGARPSAESALIRLRRIRTKRSRRHRRIALAAAVIVLLLGGLKYTRDLRFERGRADEQRARAEDLFGFMLGDLGPRLEEVGRLDIMDGVGNQALRYFAGRDTTSLDVGDTRRLARTLNLIGEIRMKRGQPDSAEVAFRRARELLRARAVAARGDAEAQALLGSTEFWLGSVAYGRGDLARATECFRTYHRISRELVSADPTEPRWRQELAYAQTNLAAVYRANGETASALLVLDEAIAAKRALLADDPADADLRSSLANSEAMMAEVQSEAWRFREALEHLHRARLLAEEALASSPLDAELSSRCSTLLQREGVMLLNLGHVGDARPLLERDLDLARELVGREPENVDWRVGYAISLATAMRAAVYADRVDEADALRREWTERGADAGTGTDGILARASVAREIARLDLSRGRPADALRGLGSSLAELEPRVATSGRCRISSLRSLALAMAAACLTGEAARYDAARDRFATLWADGAGVDGDAPAVASRRDWAWLTGDEEIVETTSGRLDGAGWAAPAEGWLRRLIAGSGKVDEHELVFPCR
ncbi:protein kinase [bacterium]|nr:protein kinase [bacterium]